MIDWEEIVKNETEVRERHRGVESVHLKDRQKTH